MPICIRERVLAKVTSLDQNVGGQFRESPAAPRQQTGELRSVNSAIRMLCARLPILVWTTDRNLRLASAPATHSCRNGTLPEAHTGDTLHAFFGTDDPDFIPIRSSRKALNGEDTSYEMDWNDHVWQGHIEPLRNDAGEIVGTVGMAFDVTTERRAVEEKLEGEQRYRELFDNAADMIFTLDLKGNFTSVNRAAERITGYSRCEILAMNASQVVASDQVALMQEKLQSKLGGEAETVYKIFIQAKTGQRIQMEVGSRLLFRDGRPVGIQGIARDITERTRLEEHLQQTQKMEAIGVLAGGIAHDFNNLLTGILGYTDLLKAATQPGERFYEGLDVIEKAAEQAAQLTSQLLGFARRGKNKNVPIQVHEILRQVSNILARTIDKRIVITTRFERMDVLVVGDPNQVFQVFFNLAINAKEAMPEGGELTFQTELLELDSPFGSGEVIRPGTYVAVTVKDTGVGIPEELQARVFEPFFTTKDQGSGMGLAMVYGIVKNHGGQIKLTSGLNEGSTFRVLLPVSRETIQAKPQMAPSTIACGLGRILIVDDEEVVRNVAATMLRDFGYQVVVQADAEAAVRYYAEHHAEIDMVIMDMTMPKLSGRECFRAMQNTNPTIKALLASGYGNDGEAQEILDLGMAGFIQKPFQVHSLIEAVHDILTGQPRRVEPIRESITFFGS